MILYHFCPACMKDAILKMGLTLGGFPLVRERRIVYGTQWLTSEPDPKKQSWATSVIIPYSRTDYRLTVNIPASFQRRLVSAKEFVKTLPEEDRGLVTDWEGSSAWYVCLGKIPPKWIAGCRNMKGGR